MFVKIAEAYEILSDSEKRNRYDTYYFSDKSHFSDQENTKTHKNAEDTSGNNANDGDFHLKIHLRYSIISSRT